MLIVKKFGGTSVGDKQRMYNVANRCIEEYKKEMTWWWFCPPWENIQMS